jgi:hypothetical protein
MHYLMEFLCILNMGAHFQIGAREVFWMVYNNKKPIIFCDILYCLKVIFFQHVFEALNNAFSYLKTMRIKCIEVHSIFADQMKYPRERDIYNCVNHSSNSDFMRKLQVKQWRVNFKTQLTSEGHKCLFRNHIEAHENSMEIY